MSELPEIIADETAEPDGKTIEQVGGAMARLGFVSVRHPALDQDLLERVHEQAARLFDLDLPRKRALTNASTGTLPRGHSIFGAQRARDGHPGELKEAWHIGPESSADLDMTVNIWPDELPEFRGVARAIFIGLHTIGAWVLRCCERHLDLPNGRLTGMVEGGPALLRLSILIQFQTCL